MISNTHRPRRARVVGDLSRAEDLAIEASEAQGRVRAVLAALALRQAELLLLRIYAINV